MTDHGNESVDYQYGGPSIGVYDSRHEAVGQAALVGRQYGSHLASRLGHDGHVTGCVLEYTEMVHVVPHGHCFFCGETFHSQESQSAHLCEPRKNYDPGPGRQGSNPLPRWSP